MLRQRPPGFVKPFKTRQDIIKTIPRGHELALKQTGHVEKVVKLFVI